MNERERRDLFWDCVSWTVNVDVDIKSREDNYASAWGRRVEPSNEDGLISIWKETFVP